jgi:hypothetical protein
LARVEFDTTIDECVDVQIRLINHSTTYGRRRLRSRVLFSLAMAALFCVGFFFEVRPVTPLAAVGVGAGLGTLLGYLYGIYYDWHVRQHEADARRDARRSFSHSV